jgi:hypothetical protein
LINLKHISLHISLLDKYDYVLWYKIKRNFKETRIAVADRNKAIDGYYKLFEQIFSDFLFMMELERNVQKIFIRKKKFKPTKNIV